MADETTQASSCMYVRIKRHCIDECAEISEYLSVCVKSTSKSMSTYECMCSRY